jgi:hypothetical protein
LDHSYLLAALAPALKTENLQSSQRLSATVMKKQIAGIDPTGGCGPHPLHDEETTMIRETIYEVCNALAALSVVAFVFIMCLALT